MLRVGGETIASFTEEQRKKGASGGPETTCAFEVRKAEQRYLTNARIKLYVSRQHISDFLGCVKSRKKPITSEQVGARSAICCHLLNQSYYHHAHLKWDPARFQFTDGTGDPKWLTRDYRSPWTV